MKNQRMKVQNIEDALKKHPKPQAMMTKKVDIPGGISTLKCLDAKGCRVMALTMRTRGLPVFCPLDEWEPYESRPLDQWDFVYIDMGDCRIHPGLFPYTGSRYYATEVA